MKELLDLNITVLRSRTLRNVPEGQVISQQPAKRPEISKGGRVSVVVSQGARTKADVNNLVETVTIEYVPEERIQMKTTKMEIQTWKPKESRKQFESILQDRNIRWPDPFMNLRLQKIQTGE